MGTRSMEGCKPDTIDHPLFRYAGGIGPTALQHFRDFLPAVSPQVEIVSSHMGLFALDHAIL